MIIQKILEASHLERVVEFEITNEKMRQLPYTFGNFRDEQEFHSAFFDQSHPGHAHAYEILEHVLRPDSIYERPKNDSNEHWASEENLRTDMGDPVFVFEGMMTTNIFTNEELGEISGT